MDKKKVESLKEKIYLYKRGMKVASTHTLSLKRRVSEVSRTPVYFKKEYDKKVMEVESFVPEENI